MISTIVATMNNNIISIKNNGDNYLPHLHGEKFFPESVHEKIKNFRDNDNFVFKTYIKQIKSNSVIVMGENTFSDSFPLFKKILKDKNICFIVSNNKRITKTIYLANDWNSPLVFSPINNLSKDKDSFKKVLVKTTKEEALNLSSDIHVMGGKSVYEAFNGFYDKIVVNNFNIPKEIINEIELQSDIVFNRVRLDNE